MFESAFGKIERAEKHIDDLETAFHTFRDSCKQTPVIEHDPHTGEPVFAVRCDPPIPSTFAFLIGDAIHNMRSALDHATWEVLGIDGGTQDQSTSFPFSKTKAEYETACNGIKTPRSDTKKFFIDLAAYPTGIGEKFYRLHRLDIIDKHQTVTPMIGVTGINDLQITNPNGKTLKLTNCTFAIGPDGLARMIGGFSPADHIQLDQQCKPTIEIFFHDVAFFQGVPLIDALMDLMFSVRDIIARLEEFITARV